MTILLERDLKKGSFPILVPVLEKWQELVEKTAKSWIKDGDSPSWYNERASLSLLAGAIWLRNGSVFEEFSTYRKMDTKRGVPYKRGRCDIEFKLKSQYFIAESKQCWPILGQSKQNAVPMVKSHLEQAKKEVAQVWANGYHSLAIVFAVPMIPVKYQNKMSENISELITQVADFKKTTVAWVFPKATRNLRPSNKTSPYHNYIYPGVILAIMSCKA